MKHGGPKLLVALHLKDDVPGLLSQTDAVITGIDGHAALFPGSSPLVQGL